jgi:hypothetical protein
MIDAIHKLSSQSLRSLSISLRNGALSSGITRHALQQIAGPQAAELERCLDGLLEDGIKPAQLAMLAEAIVDARESTPGSAALFDLVLSGPEVPGIPTGDTAAVMLRLIEKAQSEILLVGYAVHNGRRLFERLAARMQLVEALQVIFCLDIPRKHTDTSLSTEIVRRFAQDFRKKHWPWPQLPKLFYDPRSLSESLDQRSSLHAKCVVVDRRVALITSANFTEAAQHRNIEAGVLVRDPLFVERLAGYFDGLRASGQLVCCPLV